MAKPVRRIVTGHNAAGQSVILADGPAPNVVRMDNVPEFALNELWLTDATPASNEGDGDAADRPVRLPPPARGSVFRIADLPPDSVRYATGVDTAATTTQFGASDAYAAGKEAGAARHPGFHKTDSVDYAIVLEGEVYALMDVGETLMRAGDVLIQRGTHHAWSNRSDKVCRMAFVLIDAAPV